MKWCPCPGAKDGPLHEAERHLMDEEQGGGQMRILRSHKSKLKKLLLINLRTINGVEISCKIKLINWRINQLNLK